MTDKTVRYMAGSRIDAQCGQCGQSALVTVMEDDTRLCESCQSPYVPPEITPDMLLKWAGYVPPAPKGMASEHVFTGEVSGWTERTVPAEPAPKLCKRCAALLIDGKHCPVNPRHNRKPKVTARRDVLAGFQPDAETVIRQSIAPRTAPAHPPVVAAGRTVVTVRKGKSEAEFAPPAKSGKTQGFSPLPNPVYNPVTPTSAQSAANREAAKMAGKPNRKSANVTRYQGRRFNGNAACTTCQSAVSEAGQCLNVAWHMTALDS